MGNTYGGGGREATVKLASALRAGVRLPVAYARTILPLYLLATSATAVARVPLLVAVAVVAAVLRAQGRIQPVVSELDGLQPDQIDPSNASALPPGLVDAVGNLVTPTVVGVLAVGLLAAFVVGVVAQSAAAGAKLAGVYAALDDRPPLVAGVGGLRRYWTRFLGFTLVRYVLFGLALVPVVVGLQVGLFVGIAGSGIAGLLVGLAGLFLSFVLFVAVFLGLAFGGPAIVVDDVGIGGAIRRSLGFIRREPIAVGFYAIVTTGTFVAVGTAAVALNVAGVQQLVGVLVALLVTPALDGFKTSLYADEGLPKRSPATPSAGDPSATSTTTGAEAAASTPEPTASPPLRARVSTGVERGVRALGGFVRYHPLANVASVAVMAAGIAGGYAYTAPFGASISGPADVAGVFGAIPVGPFVNIAANNWLVAATSSYSGLALGVSTVAGLLFNGALVGMLAGVYDRLPFVLLVAPHGIVELPALAVAGGLGLHLGRVGLEWVRGRRDVPSVADELESAFDVLVGLAIVLVVAAFVEAFLTPRIAAALLGV